jgi:hypothetical protein
MSYLDDPEHPWVLEPPDGMSWEDMVAEIWNRNFDGLRLILQGYAGLKCRYPEATDEDCLRTSMVWYYG